LALQGDFNVTRMALRYVHQHPRLDDADTLAEVLRRGRHLFEDELYKAIEATYAKKCVEPLRALLTGQHIDVRRRAAAALRTYV
jgi:hypothetical protein